MTARKKFMEDSNQTGTWLYSPPFLHTLQEPKRDAPLLITVSRNVQNDRLCLSLSTKFCKLFRQRNCLFEQLRENYAKRLRLAVQYQPEFQQ